MPNPLHQITNVFKDYFTTEDKDIYIDAIKLLDHCATELDQYEYETDSDGEKLSADLKDSIADYEKSLNSEDEENDEDEDEDVRHTEDLDEEDEVVKDTEIPLSTEEVPKVT